MLKNKTKTTAQKLTFGNKNFYYFLLVLFISFSNNLIAQNIISIPFSDGFVGDNAANNKSINSKYLTALGWSNIQFSQNSPQFIFVAQGNDIPGSVLITDFAGSEHAIPGFIKWRAPSGGNITTPVFQPTSGATLATNSSNGSATYSITNLSYIGLTYNGDTLVIPSSGSNAGEVTGNAATQGILDSLNSYLGSFPTISISDSSANENVGNKVITVSLSATSSQTVTVNFNTANNTALSGSDYVSQSGTLTFNAGDLTKTITLSIIDDSVYEADETFYVQLSDATNASIVDPSTTITILNDDAQTPSITSTGTLNTFNACAGTASTEQSISVSGTNLVSDINVTAPTGYELSLTSGGTYSNSVALTQISGSVSSTPIYIRLKNDALNGASGNITCTATNATSVNVSTGSAVVGNPTVATSNALNFDGSNDYVVSTVSGTSLTTFSIEMYVKPIGNQNQAGIFQWADQTSSGNPMALIQLTGTTLNGYVDAGYQLTTTLPAGSWSHIALTYDGTIYKFYINGALVDSYTGGIQFQNLATKIYFGNGFTNFWNGSMDEARVWSTARTQAEIQQFMNSELVGTESGLLSYFNFNEGTANGNNTALISVTDSSSNNVSGSINNMALTGTSSNFVTGIMTNNSISAMNQNLCVNGSATALTSSLSGGSGLTYQWYSNSTSNNTGGTLIANATSSSFTPPTNQIGTTYYYVVVTNSSGCVSPSTVSGAISVNAVPTIALSSSSNNVTYSANSQTTTISYSGSTGSPTTYSISWNANPSNSFAAVAYANLSSSPITIDVPAGTNNGTYTGTLTVTNASNCTSSNSSFTVTVNNGDVTAPTITYPTSQNNNSSLKISENTTSVTTFTANEQVTWSITGGSERTLFSINSSGVLTFNSAPTFANPSDSSPTNSYIVEVTATDSNGNFSRQMLTVFISPLCGNWNN